MPNHAENNITITHTDEAQIKWLRKQFKGNKKEGYTPDFNKLIPMPKELDDTVSPTEVVATQAEADKINAEYAKDGVSALCPQKIKAISKAEHERRLKEYGADNWYDWAYHAWGTKWNSYSGRILKETPTSISCVFSTAWCHPEPIFDFLIEKGFEINGYTLVEGEPEPVQHGDGGEFYANTEIEFAG